MLHGTSLLVNLTGLMYTVRAREKIASLNDHPRTNSGRKES